MIYHDPTEARPRTRVPSSTLGISRPVANLEQFTGADFLIDPYDDLLLPDELKDIPPHRVTLLQHCQSGVLIQRKSGRDLLGSIAELDAIQARMLEWSSQAWLVATGISRGGEKSVAVFGRKVKNWKWATVQGAETAWRLRGGSVVNIKTDNDLTELFKRIEFKIKEYFTDSTKMVAQKGHVQKVKLIDRNWLNTLSAWPIGIGRKHLTAVAKFVVSRGHEPSLINVARCILSGQAKLNVGGWGDKRTDDVREWWGIDHDQPLDVIVVSLGTKDQPAKLSEYSKGSIVLPDDDRLKPRRKS